MTITFVTKDTNKPERWKRLDLQAKEENPFRDIAKEGEKIPIDELINFIFSPYIQRGTALRKIQKWCLHVTLDSYQDIRYYYGQS